jgi:hypothetical protein
MAFMEKKDQSVFGILAALLLLFSALLPPPVSLILALGLLVAFILDGWRRASRSRS